MDRNELANWLDRMCAVAEANGFRTAEFHVDKLREIRDALRQSAWRPMSEAPRDGAWFIVWPKDYVRPSVGCWYVPWDRWEISGSPSGIDGIEDAVWQPLPPPPTGEVGT
jgi:hypothetical protein